MSGCIKINIDKEIIFHKNATLRQKYLAEEIYWEEYSNSIDRGVPLFNDLLSLSMYRGFWSKKEEEDFNSLPKEIEKLKLDAYLANLQSNKRKMLKKMIKGFVEKYTKLYNKRNSFYHISVEGISNIAKMRFLTGVSCYRQDDSKLFLDLSFWQENSDLLDQIISKIEINRIEDSTFRLLARSEPWRSTWLCKKAGNLFNCPIIDLTDEQKMLCYWSVVYDNVFESMDCPDEEVIEDDDLLDGWFINQKNEKEKEKKKSLGEKLAEKHPTAQEIFVPVDSIEDARKVESFNTEDALSIKKARDRVISDRGFVNNDLAFNDVKRDIMIQKNKQFLDTVKGR